MFEEIQLSGINAKEIASQSNITLIGNQVEEHYKCTDSSSTLYIEGMIYVVKVSNGQTVSIHIYDMKDLFHKQILLTSEYINFSHLITQNGCIIMRDNEAPYLLVVTQTGQIFYKNLISNTSSIIKNLMVDNQRFVCLAKSLINNNSIKFYVLSDDDQLYFISIDVRKGEIVKSKYQLSFGTKFLSKFFVNQTNDWKTVFQINDKQLIHYSFQTQFHLLEIKGSDLTTKQLQIEDNIKVKQIQVFQHKPNGQITLCYLQLNQMKIYSLIGNQLRINCVIFNLDFLQNTFFSVSSIQNTIILIQGTEVYQLFNENNNFELINSNKLPVLGFINLDDQLLLFYKNHISFINQVQDQISKRQYQLRQNLYNFKKEIETKFKLKDEELILQSISIDYFIENKFDYFQTLIKFMHRNLDQKKIIQLMKQQQNNFFIDDFMNELMDDLEDIYYYLKPTFQKLDLDFNQTYTQLSKQLNCLDQILLHIYQKEFQNSYDNKQDQWVKFSLLKSFVVNQLKDYYYMYLEIYLGLIVLANISNNIIDLQNDHKLFYDTMLLLTLFQDKSQVSFQDLLKRQFSAVSNDIKLQQLTSIQNVVYRFINLVYSEVFRNFAISEDLLCEAFVQNQKKSLINQNNAKHIIRYCQVSQQIGLQQHNILQFINENEDQYQELKLRISFFLQKQQTPQNEDDQEIVLKKLISYAIKQEQYQLLFQILNMNETKQIHDQLSLMVESDQLFKCQLNARTTDLIADLLLQYCREKCNNLKKAEKMLQYFSFLMKQESKGKAFTLLFEYIVNIEILLFTLKFKDIVRGVRIQLDYIKILLNQMELQNKQDQLPYSKQLICKLSDQNFEQFQNPSTINDKSEINLASPKNIRIVNQEQIIKLKKYKEIQNFVCVNYSPYAQLNKVVEQLILNGNLNLLIQVFELNLDPNFEKNIVFFYFSNNERKRQELLDKVKPFLSKKDFSIVLAQICVVCNLNLEKCKELFKMAQSQEYFLQYLINVDKQSIAYLII
ncbi:unnamed protein product [Paramecium sonneborni]|uniref:Uncharacterized protein n=1 Tax=Paramecium sonneborni TaxID=65129 RepID=A0A8S1QUZ7_9CILI|nr:unnamed protein product [Paramecium sonneborni]